MKNLIIVAWLFVAVAGVAFSQSQSAPSQPAPGQPDQSAASQPTPAPAANTPPAEPTPTPAPVAAPTPAPTARVQSFLEQELNSAASELSSGQVGNLTIDDVEKITDHIAIAIQKERYVQRLRNASFALPGLGQFMGGDTLGGWLFVAWDVTVFAGTLLGAYFVLPSNVQFGSLNYLGSSWSTVQAAWASNSILSYLPLAGVITAGVLLETALRYASADNAAKTARKNISEGKVTFQPSFDLDRGLGLGLQMNY